MNQPRTDKSYRYIDPTTLALRIDSVEKKERETRKAESEKALKEYNDNLQEDIGHNFKAVQMTSTEAGINRQKLPPQLREQLLQTDIDMATQGDTLNARVKQGIEDEKNEEAILAEKKKRSTVANNRQIEASLNSMHTSKYPTARPNMSEEKRQAIVDEQIAKDNAVLERAEAISLSNT